MFAAGENSFPSAICIIACLSPACIIWSFLLSYVSDKHHLASSLLRQPWHSPDLEGSCSLSFSLASKYARRKRNLYCSVTTRKKKIYLGGQAHNVACSFAASTVQRLLCVQKVEAEALNSSSTIINKATPNTAEKCESQMPHS